LQQFHENFHPFHDNQQLDFHERKREVGRLIQSEISLHSYDDPFVVCLEIVSRPEFADFVKFEFVCKFLFELPLSGVFFSPPNKHIQGGKLVDKMLAWLHWVFDFN